MKRFTQLSLAVILGGTLVIGGWAQEQAQTQNKKRDNEKVKLQQKNQVQNQIIHGPNFVDEDGDGFNDNAPDHDGDGIPNGQDADYTGQGKGKRQQRFIDVDGDGIADNVGMGTRNAYGRKGNKRGGYGPGDGTGHQGVRPQDGTGFGPGAGSENCDGTGPKGKINRGN